MTSITERFQELSGRNLIGGRLQESNAATRPVIDPATEAELGRIPETGAEEINEAIAIAREAQRKWWALSALDRTHMLHEVADRMLAQKAELAEALTREMGKPYKESADEVDWSAHSIRYSAEIGRSDQGRVMGPAVAGQFHYTLKQPLGTAALIMPFNYPMTLLAWEAGAAFAAGNAVIVKPSEYTTLTTLLFAEAFEPLPKGLFQVICGAGETGKRLVEHDGSDMVVFTGSVPVGRAIAKTCGDLMKRCLIESSGNDPFLVMPTAPMDVTARAASFSAYMNCGQICVSAERYFVHEKVHDEFVERLVNEAQAIRVGNGLEKVDMGPMVSSKERDRYEGVIKTACDQGARVVHGGGRPAGFNQGWFVEPTVLVDCTPDMEIFNQESFGPVAPICRVGSFEEALELANNSRYGLGANSPALGFAETPPMAY